MSLFGSLFGSDPQTTTTTQTQTANPLTQQGAQSTYDWLAAAQAQPYSNMPMQQIAGFTPDQQAAFEATRAAQGQANPWFTQAGNLVTAGAGFSPDAVAATYKDLSTPVLASLYDQFGQQRSQMAGNLRSAAGGTGADRINVGLADLAKQQSLAAGQTESGLLATAINTEMQKRQMMQSAGALTGQLGGQQQAATYADIANLYGMGGQQQQLAQAQQNAQYQYGLGQFMYPSQLAQMGAGITAQLAPGLGGTTTGTRTVPGQPIGTTLAGLGMTALGAYMSGGTSLIPGLFGAAAGGAGGGTGSAMPSTPAPNGSYWGSAPGGGWAPTYGAAGGRINYDEGGEVEASPQRPFDYGRAGNRLMMAGLKMASKRPSFDSTGGRVDPYSILKPYNLGGMVPHYEDGGDVPFDDRWEPATELLGGGSMADRLAPGEYASAAGPFHAATLKQAEPFIQQIADRSTKLDPEAHDRWAAGVDDTNRDRLPPIMTAGMRPQLPAGATAYADDADTDTVPRQSPYLPSRRVPIPPLPDYGDLGRPDKSGEIYRNPWMALMGAGLGTMAAAAERNPDGTLKHPGILSAVGKGGMHGVEMLREQQKSALEEKRAELDLRKSLEASRHWRTAAEQENARQQFEREKFDRPYEEMTEAQKQTARRQDEEDLLKRQTPIKIMDPESGEEVSAVRRKDGTYGVVDAATGTVRDASPEEAAKAGERQRMMGTEYRADLAQRNPARMAQLQQLYDGRIKPPTASALRSRPMQALQRQMVRAFPDWDASIGETRFRTRNEFAVGVTARNLDAIKTVMGHGTDMSQVVDILNNKNVRAWNSLSNAVRDQFGDTRLGEYKAAETAFAEEIAKMFQGAGVTTESAKQRWLDVFSSSRSVGQHKAIIGRIMNLAESRMAALADRYNKGMNLSPDDKDYKKTGADMLSTEAREKFEKLKEWSKSGQEALSKEQKAKVDTAARDAEKTKGDYVPAGERDGDYISVGGPRKERSTWKKVGE